MKSLPAKTALAGIGIALLGVLTVALTHLGLLPVGERLGVVRAGVGLLLGGMALLPLGLTAWSLWRPGPTAPLRYDAEADTPARPAMTETIHHPRNPK